jgi:hypothetical protein
MDPPVIGPPASDEGFQVLRWALTFTDAFPRRDDDRPQRLLDCGRPDRNPTDA